MNFVSLGANLKASEPPVRLNILALLLAERKRVYVEVGLSVLLLSTAFAPNLSARSSRSIPDSASSITLDTFLPTTEKEGHRPDRILEKTSTRRILPWG